MMIRMQDEYEIDDARQRFDLSRVQQWMTTTYWWNDTASADTIKRTFDNSLLLVGAYHDGVQVGCCRVVTDLSRFAWLADVYVTSAHRKRGLARAMVRFVLEHPDCRTITRFVLVTRDAHKVYTELGFEPLPDPQAFMQFRPPPADR